MNVTTMSIKDLRIAEKNVRKHPQRQIEELQRSYEMFGQYRPLVVSHDGEILVGNGLFEALQQLGVETVEAIRLPENASESYKQKLMLADNKIYSLGSDNMVNIDEILASIEDFVIPGFDEATLQELYAVAEEMEEQINEMTGMGKVPAERVEQVNQVKQEREENPPEIKPQVKAEVPPKENVEESGSYVTCPHCGMKIWL